MGLFDDRGYNGALRQDWGVSIVVEEDGKKYVSDGQGAADHVGFRELPQTDAAQATAVAGPAERTQDIA